jgi:hypothetical protein
MFTDVSEVLAASMLALMMEEARTSETLVNLADYTALRLRRQPSSVCDN